MNGLFHDEQRLLRDDRGRVVGVTLSGPINWDTEETSASIEASIWRGDVEVARGSTAGDVPASEAEWSFDVRVEGDAALEPGDATGKAKAVVRSGEKTETTEWDSSVELV